MLADTDGISETTVGGASPTLEKMADEPSLRPDPGSESLGRCLSGRSHSTLRRKVVGGAMERLRPWPHAAVGAVV